MFDDTIPLLGLGSGVQGCGFSALPCEGVRVGLGFGGLGSVVLGFRF